MPGSVSRLRIASILGGQQLHVPRLTLGQTCDLAVVTAEHQIPLPVTSRCVIIVGGWSLADRYGVENLTVDRRFFGCSYESDA